MVTCPTSLWTQSNDQILYHKPWSAASVSCGFRGPKGEVAVLLAILEKWLLSLCAYVALLLSVSGVPRSLLQGSTGLFQDTV